ncbi:MAG: hypothetical protein J6L92_03625 [Clostridia bacterium]|nr:hypothetical protein [Clostridia bacterium]
MNEQRVENLEKEITRYVTKRRIITAVLFVVFLAMGIAFSAIREATKEVTVVGEGYFSYEIVNYNDNYVIGIMLGFLTATVLGCILFTDAVFCRFNTAAVNGHFVTVYRGMNKCSVYIDGEEVDNIGMFSFTNAVDTRLPDGTKVSVAFNRSAFMIAHVSFSDNNPPIDL